MSRPDDPLYVSVDNVSVCGLATRELFAAMAMQGILANEHPAGCATTHDAAKLPEHAAKQAVMMADALIAELAKPNT